ncbi:MAG TPA: Plug domain-containing protein, partial [Gemmatimonadales bacterium]|nr:Plug domain-containing protein [Gemmatimonadales bacterium]
MLLVSAIGYHPIEVLVQPDQPDPLIVELEPVPPTLRELGVAGTAQQVTGSDNNWVVDGTATRSVPASVEPDLFRALALAPAVSFSSIRSSRPLVRGIDADDVAFTIDGHEVVNLYHIGRSFSAFPALLAEAVSVRTQPAAVDVGRTTSGRIEIRGAEWAPGRRTELQYGIGAWTGLTGWSDEALSMVAGVRTFEGSVAAVAAPDGANSLEVQDFYGRVDIRQAIPLKLTFFRSTDRGADTDPRHGDLATLDWESWLVGAKADLLRLPWLGLDLRAAYSSRAERGEDVPARRTTLMVDNHVARSGVGFDGRLGMVDGAATLRFGGEMADRRVLNRITP